MKRKTEAFLKEFHPLGSYRHTLQIFLKDKANEVSEGTLERFYYNLHPIGGKTDQTLTNLTNHWLKSYIDDCWLRYAPETMRTIIGDVRHFFKWCKKNKHHPQNIAKIIKPVGRRKRRVRTKAAPESDIRAVIEYLTGNLKLSGLMYRDLFGNWLPAEPKHWDYEAQQTVRDLFIIVFLYETGARAGELSKLGTKAMNKAISQPSSAYSITVIGKSNDRDYLFTNRTVELWKLWEKVRPDDHKEYAVVGWRHGRLANKLLPNGISHILVRRCKQAATKPFRTHSLRHAKVQRSRRKVGLVMASKLIDHSNIATTERYANIEHDEMVEAATKTGLQFDIWSGTS